MNPTFLSGALGAAALCALSTAALAHATLEQTEATANAAYRGVVRIGHGCDGAPTTRVAVTIPEGVIAAKPMPKPGWTLATSKGAYAKGYPYHGKTVSEGVREIVWSGGSLADDFYDEFVFTARITDAFAPGATVHFPVVQDCAQGSLRWVEVPEPGQGTRKLAAPAPGVLIVAGGAADPRSYKAGALTIEAPWSRATPGGAKVAGGYLRITNAGPEADRLTGGSLAPADTGEVHEMSMDGGIMRMRRLEEGLVIPPGQTVELKPGGLHMMFMGLKSGLKEGEAVKGTLIFEKAGTVAVEFQVRGVGATGGGAGEHRH